MIRIDQSKRATSSLMLVIVALSLSVGSRTTFGASRFDRAAAGKFYVSNVTRFDDCAMFELFDQVARTANVSLGFENAPGCGFGQRTIVLDDRGRALVATTAREAFDEIVALNGHFQWQEIDGMAIVRPATAWHDADNLLNRPAQSFQLMNVAAGDALYRVLDAATPRVTYAQSPVRAPGSLEAPVSVDFGGGSLLRALNAVVRARGDAEWRVGYASGQAAILVGRLSKLSEPAVGYVSRIVWKAPSEPF